MKSKANIVVLQPKNQPVSGADRLKWILISILLLAGLVGNYYYIGSPWILRLGAWIVLLALVCLIAYSTKKGKWVVEFFRESRTELRKVVWPTREETTQTTLVVAVMVVILALLLWGIDSVLVWAIGWLTGQHS